MLQHNRNNHLPKTKAWVKIEGRNDCDPNKAEFVHTSLTSITCYSIIEIITFQNTKLGLILRGKVIVTLMKRNSFSKKRQVTKDT